MTMLLPGPEGSEHDDLCGDGERCLTDEECIALKTSCGQPLDKDVYESEVVSIMHGDGYLGLELLQHLTGRFWPHGIDAANGDQRNVNASDLLELLRGERMAQVSQVHDTQDLKLEQENRLVMVRNVDEVKSKIVFQKRDKSRLPDATPREALCDIVDHVEAIIRQEYAGK